MMQPAIQALAEEFLQGNPLPGLTLAAWRPGEEMCELGFGLQNCEEALPAIPRTRFGIGSITKSFTAIAILQLAEAGRLAVTDPISRHLPELRLPRVEEMTIHHLLSHTSGLPPMGTENHATTDPALGQLPPLGRAGRTRIDSADEHLALLSELDVKLIAPPGATMSYSNDGYALLGLIIERVSGMACTDYIETHILQPLGLQDTRFGSFDQAGAGAQRYRLGPEGKRERVAGTRTARVMAAAGGGPQLSTPHDLLQVARLLQEGGTLNGRRVLGADSVRLMMTPHAEMAPRMWYGYGLVIQRTPDGATLVGHEGGDDGVAASLLWSVADGAGVAVQANQGADLSGISRRVLDLLRGAPAQEGDGLAEVALTEEIAARFAGQYGEILRVGFEEGALYVDRRGQRFPAVPVEGNALRVQLPGSRRSLLALATGSDGTIYGIRLGSRVVPRKS